MSGAMASGIDGMTGEAKADAWGAASGAGAIARAGGEAFPV